MGGGGMGGGGMGGGMGDSPFGGMFMGQGMGSSPFGGMGQGMGGGMPGAARQSARGHHSHQQQQQQPQTPEVVVRDLQVSLEDLFHGFTKRLRITRKIQDSTGSVRTTAEEISVTGKPGWKAGTKLTYHGKGDKLQGRPPQDIQIVIKEKPHKRFRREGDNLHMDLQVDLVDALCGFERAIQSIDGQAMQVKVKQAKPDEPYRVAGKGMPRKAGGRGDMLVHFKIKHPTLTASQQSAIRQILASSSS